MIENNSRIICQKCKFYFVTWQPNQPHGCHAYGFKARLIPSMVVKQSSGIECGFYELKIREDSNKAD